MSRDLSEGGSAVQPSKHIVFSQPAEAEVFKFKFKFKFKNCFSQSVSFVAVPPALTPHSVSKHKGRPIEDGSAPLGRHKY